MTSDPLEWTLCPLEQTGLCRAEWSGPSMSDTAARTVLPAARCLPGLRMLVRSSQHFCVCHGAEAGVPAKAIPTQGSLLLFFSRPTLRRLRPEDMFETWVRKLQTLPCGRDEDIPPRSACLVRSPYSGTVLLGRGRHPDGGLFKTWTAPCSIDPASCGFIVQLFGAS